MTPGYLARATGRQDYYGSCFSTSELVQRIAHGSEYHSQRSSNLDERNYLASWATGGRKGGGKEVCSQQESCQLTPVAQCSRRYFDFWCLSIPVEMMVAKLVQL